ncbi:transglycosylase SLT domain-containing protein [Actinoplanes sp. NBRC 103695]|uniref:transglycosylase SLT domain-containing protein n=1 Tax=Actinoplanes sp. NBRC 103695 TaxID=3032202 RepID=UPI0024A064C9|nr:transglycosylase SLT domain-containing protein [Actinoplanes sp. NBRC 103695]GLZ02165.1 hypothetical protein Acsp02_94160 [Actinoplanes sp. NBRC 103695]
MGSEHLINSRPERPRPAAVRAEARHGTIQRLQVAAGNTAVTALLTVQRDPATDKAVGAVKSPNVELREGAVHTAQEQLNKRMQKRRDEIQELLGLSAKNAKRAATLQSDLGRDLADIITTPDTKGIGAALRKDVIESAKLLAAQQKKLDAAVKQWAKFDPIFAGSDVTAALGRNSLTPAELKALIAQESGDLTKNDQDGDIAGIAQMGTKEEKRVGGKPGDRKKPEKAIVLGAKILSTYAKDLDAALKKPPAPGEHRKFVMAAYNAGVNAVVTAQEKAIAMNADGTTWAGLVTGGDKSPLWAALIDTYKDKEVPAKYKETTEYVEKILARLP